MGKIKSAFVPKVIGRQLVLSIVAALALCLIASTLKLRLDLNFEAYLDALVNLNAGIIIAVFLAVFHSTNDKMVSFRQFKTASKQQYQIFLMNCALICFLALFVTNPDTASVTVFSFNQGALNILAATVVSGSTFTNLYYVYKILTVAFSK